MDILYLLDRLEEVLTMGRPLPFTERRLVDEQECLAILDQVRVAIPDEMQSARRVIQERDQLLDEARREADRLLREADAHRAGQLSEHALVRAARLHAAELEDDAARHAEDVRREADEYAYRTLDRLRQQVQQVAHTIDEGMSGYSGPAAERERERPHAGARGR